MKPNLKTWLLLSAEKWKKRAAEYRADLALPIPEAIRPLLYDGFIRSAKQGRYNAKLWHAHHA